METDVWSVEEADSDSLSTAIKLLSLSFVTVTEPVLLYCILMCVRFV